MLEFAEKKFREILNSVGKKEDDVYNFLCQMTHREKKEMMTLCEKLPVSVFETDMRNEAQDIANRLSALEADATVEELEEEEELKIAEEKRKLKKKRNWGKIITWIVVIIVGLVVVATIGVLVWAFWPEGTPKVVYLVEPANNASVQGPLVSLKFSSPDKLKPQDIGVIVENSERIRFAGKISETKKAKEFHWQPAEPLKAGGYTVWVDGKDIAKRTFSFTVFEVEETTPEQKVVPLVPSGGVKPSDYDNPL